MRELRFVASDFRVLSCSPTLRQSLVFREGVLEDGERVVVVGRARYEDDAEGLIASEGYRAQSRRKRLVIESHADPVRASDAVSARAFSHVR